MLHHIQQLKKVFEERQAANSDVAPEGVKTVAKFLHAHGHHGLGSALESAAGLPNTPQPEEPDSVDMLDRVRDHAKNILWNHLSVHGGFTMADAADAWQAYYEASSADDLSKKLAPMNLPTETKHELYLAFQQHREISKPPSNWRDRLDRAVDVVKRVAQLPSEHLATSESHPLVTKVMAEAAMKERNEKE
jgi:hypothetical protein